MITSELIAVLLGSIGIGVLLGFLLFMFGKGFRQHTARLSSPGSSNEGDAVSGDLVRIFQPGVGYPLFIEVGERRYRAFADIEDERERALVVTTLRKLLSQIPTEEWAANDAEEETPASTTEQTLPAEFAQLEPVTQPRNSSENDNLANSMIGEIDELFQSILTTMPDEPDASLMTAPDGSMRIKCDGEIYDDVAQIPNEEVQEALRTAVKRWERRI